MQIAGKRRPVGGKLGLKEWLKEGTAPEFAG